MRMFLSLLVCNTFLVLPACSAEPERRMILPGETFKVKDRTAFIFLPAMEKRAQPQPWVFYAPTFSNLPDGHEKWMHEKFLDAGVAVAGIDVGESYGSPAGRELYSALYEELTSKRKFAAKPCMLGRSRGGLMITGWVADNLDKTSGIAGIYPVFDFRSYPGTAKAASAYGKKPEELEAEADKLNPISLVDRLAKAKVPVFLIHGDKDTLVPLDKNSAAFLATYEAAGAKDAIELVVAKGQGHSGWEGFFRSPELVAFTIARAKAGAK